MHLFRKFLNLISGNTNAFMQVRVQGIKMKMGNSDLKYYKCSIVKLRINFKLKEKDIHLLMFILHYLLLLCYECKL